MYKNTFAGITTSKQERRHLLRVILVIFILTFIAVRILVFLIMARILPDLFLVLGGTHVHHLNYGIFLLAIVGGYLSIIRPSGKALDVTVIIYAIGLSLTFDEFGMWLHLGGSYWQRASFDAVTVLAALLALAAFAPSPRDFRQRHFWIAFVVFAVSISFFFMLADSFRHAKEFVGSKLRQLEINAPP